MSASYEPGEGKRLDEVLRQWTVAEPLPPRFKDHVWSRISVAEARAEKPPVWLGLSQILENFLPRPRVAFAYVAALLMLGVTAGSLTAQVKSSHLESTLSARYVQAVNPYQAGDTSP